MPTPAMRWMRELTGASSSRDIGEILGKSHATILRWGKEGIPPREVIRLVIDHERDLVDTLEQLGWLSPEQRARIAPKLDHLPTDELIAELQRLMGVVRDRVAETERGVHHARREG